MAGLDSLMLQRGHFPLLLHEVKYSGKSSWGLGRVELPPYHPSMVKDGLDFASVPGLLAETVGGAVKDLEEIADKDERARRALDHKVWSPEIASLTSSGIKIIKVPIVGSIFVGTYGINPSGLGEWRTVSGIEIRPVETTWSFMVPESVTFSPELMGEYEMKDEGVVAGRRGIRCPNLWARHNLYDITAVFYKNLIIALDNQVVRKKHQAAAPASS